MRLMRLAEVPVESGDRMFRYSRAGAALGSLATVGASAVLLAYAITHQSGLAYYSAGVLALGLLVMHKFVLARFRSSNWLVRMSEDGVFIQFRSYLNQHFSAADHTVVFIPFSEIRFGRLIREQTDVAYLDLERREVEQTARIRRQLVELELTSDCRALVAALTAELANRPVNATLYKHYPVQMMAPPVLRLEWGVVPDCSVLLDMLRARLDIKIASPVEINKDLSDLNRLPPIEQENQLLELLASGRSIDAVYLARKLYGYDLKQARDFVESLHRTRTGGSH
jgi:hypothetical protein